MKKDLNLKFELNLRTRGIGITFDGKRLILTAIHNKLNQIHYMGYEVLEDFESKSDEEILDFFDEFQSVHKVRRADMFMALPRSETMVQIAEFPPEARNNLEEVMTYQLENYFPMDLESWAFFPQIIGQAEQLKVMIVAVKKERLGHIFGFIRRWKLKLSGVTLDSLALINGLAKSRPNRFADNRIAICRSLPEGIELLVSDQGRLVGGTYFPLADGEDFEAVAAGLEQGFSLTRLDPNDIDLYLWSGSDFPEVRNYLNEALGFPFQPWEDVNGKVVDEVCLPGLGAAVNAILDKPHLSLNMLPENLRKRQKRLPVILAAILFVVAGLFFVFSEVSEFTELRAEAKSLDREYVQLMDRMNEISSAKSQLEAKQNELSLYSDYQTNNLVIRLIFTLAQQLPDDTYLTHLQIKNGSDVTIQGESEDPFQTQRILTDIPFLKDVQPGNAITSGRNRDGKSRFMYRATLNLEALK